MQSVRKVCRCRKHLVLNRARYTRNPYLENVVSPILERVIKTQPSGFSSEAAVWVSSTERGLDEITIRKSADAAKAKFGGEGLGRDMRAQESRPSTLQMGMVMAGIAVSAKLMMMYDETRETERVAAKAKEFAEAQEGLRQKEGEELEAIQEIRPRTPFESAVSRDTARIRTGKWPSLEEFLLWAENSLVEAMFKTEVSARKS